MLSGIKVGKRKRKTSSSRPNANTGPGPGPGHSASQSTSAPPKIDASSDNMSVADKIRKELLSGGSSSISSIEPSGTATRRETAMDQLERRGRIQQTNHQKDSAQTKNDVVVLRGSAIPTERPAYQKEDLKNGSRKGKLKRESADVAGTSQSQANMTIEEMVSEERNNKMSMDELYARNVARVGSRYKGTELKQASASGADEEEAIDMKMYQSQRLTTVATQEKERSRQIVNHDKESGMTSRFWWWVESSSFSKHMLLALGNHVSLVLAPSHLSLVKGHCYIVPIKHADAFASCEDDVWDEVQRFQTSLRHMFRNTKNQVPIFCETVVPSSKGLWQTKMEVIPVPERQAQDAPMFFKSELTEQADEWGTHTKLLSTKDRGLRRTIPKKFSYFFVEWEQNAGYSQIIEDANFPKDFGVDTIGGMLQMDPIQFRRTQKKPPHVDLQQANDFLSRWKEFDWTLQLD